MLVEHHAEMSDSEMSNTDKIIKIEQTGSPIRRHHTQRKTLIGLGLNRIGRVAQTSGVYAPGFVQISGEG